MPFFLHAMTMIIKMVSLIFLFAIILFKKMDSIMGSSL